MSAAAGELNPSRAAAAGEDGCSGLERLVFFFARALGVGEKGAQSWAEVLSFFGFQLPGTWKLG